MLGISKEDNYIPISISSYGEGDSMLRKIKIEGLFKKFNYEIDLKEEGITILTGPNGYGKTTILKIIYAFATKDLEFFSQLPFKQIVLFGENLGKNDEIRLLKTEQDTLEINGVSYKNDISSQDIIHLLESLVENGKIKQAKQIPDFVDVYFIKEQRLLIRKFTSEKRERITINISGQSDRLEEERGESFSNTIEEYAKELSKSLTEILAGASKVGQDLDSSFPRRLFDETTFVSEQEFNSRYDVIKEKQKFLSLYGLSATKEDSQTSFKEENSKALLVYLNDTKKKLAVFDDILQKLQIFSTILNERQFVFKQLEISPDFGFRFKTENGEDLSLTDLSSGEQQEVVLLYELLFKVGPNTLVLIDEPEISLHVAWQKEVINDLLKITKLQKITVIVATHSPQIIGEHWDLVVDLWDLSEGI